MVHFAKAPLVLRLRSLVFEPTLIVQVLTVVIHSGTVSSPLSVLGFASSHVAVWISGCSQVGAVARFSTLLRWIVCLLVCVRAQFGSTLLTVASAFLHGHDCVCAHACERVFVCWWEFHSACFGMDMPMHTIVGKCVCARLRAAPTPANSSATLLVQYKYCNMFLSNKLLVGGREICCTIYTNIVATSTPLPQRPYCCHYHISTTTSILLRFT